MNQDEIIKTTATASDPLKTSVKNSRKVKRLVSLVVLTMLVLLVVSTVAYRLFSQQSTRQSTTQINQATVDRNSQQFENAAISDVVEKVAPSVVSIVTSSVNLLNYSYDSAGTGVILSSDGYILTNKHVVSKATQLTVITSDGESYDDVKIVFEDPFNDLAFLKVSNPKAFQPIEIGDSKTVKVGQEVIAIGNSLGQYQNTVTRGIISGTSRSISAYSDSQTLETLTDMLQTDAAINPGNSGGPLVNAGGQLIAINTAIAEDADGMGFAIPISAAKGVIKQLAQGGDKIQRVMLGVRYMSINPAIAKEKDLSERAGALITGSIIKGLSADRAGLQEGDIILKINEWTVGKDGSLNTLLSEYMVGEEVKMQVKRGDKTISFTVNLQGAN